MEVVDAAIRVIPHVGPILAAVFCIAMEIREELQGLPSKFHAEKQLGEEANDIINDITELGQNIEVRFPRHAEKLKRKAKGLEDVAKDIRRHVWKVSGKRQINRNDFGEKFAHFAECFKPSDTRLLKRRLEEAKDELVREFHYIKMLQTLGENDLPKYSEKAKQQGKQGLELVETIEHPRWVRKSNLNKEPDLVKKLVPVCPREATEDGVIWYIARARCFGGLQPAKFRHGGKVAYYGYCRRVFPTDDDGFEVLIAERDSVSWKAVSGVFSTKQLDGARLVEGCRENDDTVLAIARAKAREHMHIGVFEDMYLQPGKASEKLDGAYLIAGKKEAHVREDYEVLVYT